MQTSKYFCLQPSRIDAYKNKGKELLAKVYLYRDGQKVVANN